VPPPGPDGSSCSATYSFAVNAGDALQIGCLEYASSGWVGDYSYCFVTWSCTGN